MPHTKSCLFNRNSRCEDLQCLHRYTPLRFARKPHHWQCVCHSRWEEVHSARRGGGALRRVARGRSSVAALSLEDLAGVFDEHRGDVLVRDPALLEGGYHIIVDVSVISNWELVAPSAEKLCVQMLLHRNDQPVSSRRGSTWLLPCGMPQRPPAPPSHIVENTGRG
jgi:hypothetical protein